MTIDEALSVAMGLQQTGRGAEAEQIYRQILAQNPGNAEALHLMGCLALQRGQPAAAVDLIRRAAAINPTQARYYSNLGEALRNCGQPEESIAMFAQAVRLEPQMAAAYSNMGHALAMLRRHKEALTAYQAAVQRQSTLAVAWAGMGGCLTELERYDEAISCFQRALAIDPAASEPYNNLGITMLKCDRLQEAIACFQRAVQLRNDYADAYSNLGHALERAKDYDRAVAACEAAIRINPNHLNAHANLGNVLNVARQYDRAMVYSRKAIELKGDFAEAYNNLAISHHHKAEYGPALENYLKALRCKSDFFGVYSNLGNLYKELGDPDKAIEACREAIRIKPDYSEAHVNLSLPLLLKGDFAAGLEEYEWRWRWPDFPTPHRFPANRRWDGSPLNGRTLLIHAEQGLGDSLQFIRYATLAAQGGGRVIIEVPAILLPVLRTVSGVSEAFAYNAPLSHYDVHVPMLSLPHAFKTRLETIPHDVPYLTADEKLAAQWADKLGNDKNLKIGLSWAGSPLHKNDRFRTISLGALAPLASVPGLSFYSLQLGPAAKETASPPPGMRLIDLTDQINDFGDSAALLANLDLVISVDTAPVHLAGGMAKPIWMLTPYAPDFRWLLDRDDSPWYPTMRLFREQSRSAWSPVIEKIAVELSAWARAHRSKRAQHQDR